MGNDGIFAINGTLLANGYIHLVEIDSAAVIEELFDVICKGADEWHIKLKRNVVEHLASGGDKVAKEIVTEVKEIGEFRAKNCGDVETEKRIHDEVWELTWVW